MTTESSLSPEKPTLDWSTAEDAYHIINGLLAGVGAAGDVIALLASALGESATKSLLDTPQWANYLDSRRLLERLKPEIEKFSATMQELAKNRPDREDSDDE
jgi:hypothetical protein